MKKYKLFIVFIFILQVTSIVGAQVKIDKEKLVKVPDEITQTLIGIRVSSDILYAVGMNGNYLRHNLETGETMRGVLKGAPIIDFDIILGQLVYIDASGKLRGQVRFSWPKTAFNASTINAMGEGVVLSGGDKSIYLAKNATQAVNIGALDFVQPVKNHYLWTIKRRNKIPSWNIDLYDCFGNFIKQVYKFSSEFHPAGLELGPIGPEGEVLLSFYTGLKREIVLIGQNGHMFWRINGPNKFCKRDLAFDKEGKLLVVDTYGKNIYISRWKFNKPQG